MNDWNGTSDHSHQSFNHNGHTCTARHISMQAAKREHILHTVTTLHVAGGACTPCSNYDYVKMTKTGVIAALSLLCL